MKSRDVRRFVTFNARFADDIEWSPSGDIARPGGRNIAHVLAELLKRQDMQVSEPEQHSYYGWAIFAMGREGDFWFLLQDAGPWLLQSENKTWFLRRPRSHDIVVANLVCEMIANQRFSNVHSFTRDEFKAAARRTPETP